jgi:hypothetical protein
VLFSADLLSSPYVAEDKRKARGGIVHHFHSILPIRVSISIHFFFDFMLKQLSKRPNDSFSSPFARVGEWVYFGYQKHTAYSDR